MPPRCVRGGIFRSDRSALLLLCLLGFESQNGVAAAQVDAALLVDVRHLDDDGITHSNNIFHALDTLGVQLGDVDEALLARSDLDEGTEVFMENEPMGRVIQSDGEHFLFVLTYEYMDSELYVKDVPVEILPLPYEVTVPASVI